jgi:single-strand DNA-binding protein
MRALNKVQLIGNLGRDPETRHLQDGRMIANLSLATSESWTDKHTGEKREKTEWHRVAIFNENLAKVAEQYLKKGSKVYLEGQLQTRKWQDKDGHDRYTTEVVLQGFNSQLIMLDGRSSNGSDQGRERSSQSFTEYGDQSRPAAPTQQKPRDEFSDEIPF